MMNKYLLDTHIFLWFFFDSQKLPKNISKVLINPENELYISAVSFWEISIKFESGKLNLGNFSPSDLKNLALQNKIIPTNLSSDTSSTFHNLKTSYHKDPFDRILIWQCITDDYIFLTEDDNIKLYRSEGLKIIE
ncbi:MAG: type II toxin-antitoxin system VapC family toxin [Ferruginibacter sp.]